MKEAVNVASIAMAKEKDQAIGIAMNSALPGWTIADFKERANVVIKDGIETLYFDGKPIIEFHPIQSDVIKTETGWTLNVTQNYRVW